MLSVTLLTANWMIGLSSLLVVALLAIRTPKEEQMLVERFGDDYRRYMASNRQVLSTHLTLRELCPIPKAE